MISKHLNILHLERRKDRMDSLLKQLSEQEISFFSIHEAIDQKVNTKQAITIGHKRIIQEAKNNNKPNCIIAEDDLVFTAKGAWNYFLSQIPEDYDLFCGVIYAGTVNEENRILNGMSATQTLYSVHERFYDFFLSQPDDVHIDRNFGNYAFDKKYYVCNPMCVKQSGGFSDNMRKEMRYTVYEENKNFLT